MTLRKNKLLENFTNTHFEKEIEILFGTGSNVSINNIKFLSQKKTYIIDVTVNITDVDLSVESYPHALEHYISESCKFLNFFEVKPIIVSTIRSKN